MVSAVTAPSAFQARVLVARLAAEGIVAHTDANDGGPYPGGPVGVLVEEERLEAALEVLGVFDDAPEAAPPRPLRGRSWQHAVVWAVAALIVALMIAGAVSTALSIAP